MIGVHEMVYFGPMYPKNENQPIRANLGPQGWGGQD
jgi:hypothetical protein